MNGVGGNVHGSMGIPPALSYIFNLFEILLVDLF